MLEIILLISEGIIMGISLPFFESDNGVLNKAARIATGDIVATASPIRRGCLRKRQSA